MILPDQKLENEGISPDFMNTMAYVYSGHRLIN